MAADEPPNASNLRTWTNAEGKVFQAFLVSCDGTQVVMRLPNGQLGTGALSKLSAPDQAFVRATLALDGNTGRRAEEVKTPEVKVDTLPPVEKRVWPLKAEANNAATEVKIVSENAAEMQFVYHAQNFEFVAQERLSVTVMQELARTFEATRVLVELLPWGIQPKPPADLGYYRAKFYIDKRRYAEEGGPANSGGVYFRKDRIFRVPFESLGLERRGKTWAKNQNFSNQTIIHEVTHQMMHDSLPFLPIWVREGTAEYTSTLPLYGARFVSGLHQKAIQEYIKAFEDRYGGSADSFSPLELLKMTSEQWHARADKGGKDQHRLYFGACLMVYYFSHLEGEGKGIQFLSYMDKIRDARLAWAQFFKQPGVKLNPDGSFTYPREMNLPAQPFSEEFGLNELPILLAGRDEAQMKKAFLDGFKKIGVTFKKTNTAGL